MKKAVLEAAPLEYTEEVAGIISTQLYSPRYCRGLVEYARAADGWTAASIFERGRGAGDAAARPAYRSARALAFDSRSPVGREFDEQMARIVRPLVNRVWQANLETHKATHIVRYAPGDFYVAHTDTIPGDDYRYFTVLCYLNEEFEGGQTTFPALNYSFKPRTGAAIIFPATYLHCAEPVTAGEKYAVVTWLCGAPPVRWI
ncbi:MAG TPA: 2OG-Fe(II) oxygenase [Pyrinomonadaceae bacterium]